MAVKTPQFTELFDDAAASFNEAVKAGVKMQEEVGKWWADALDKAGPAGFAVVDWQKKSIAVVAYAFPAAQ
jgi:hypothetical protein